MDFNKKTLQPAKDGGYKLRVWKRLPRISGDRIIECERRLVRCGCCEEKVDIYLDDDFIEINGVLASKSEWAEVLGLKT